MSLFFQEPVSATHRNIRPDRVAAQPLGRDPARSVEGIATRVVALSWPSAAFEDEWEGQPCSLLGIPCPRDRRRLPEMLPRRERRADEPRPKSVAIHRWGLFIAIALALRTRDGGWADSAASPPYIIPASSPWAAGALFRRTVWLRISVEVLLTLRVSPRRTCHANTESPPPVRLAVGTQWSTGAPLVDHVLRSRAHCSTRSAVRRGAACASATSSSSDHSRDAGSPSASAS
jgi:hypothetical protein